VFGDNADIRAVLYLDCPEEVCSKRILLRSESSGRIDDNVNSLKKRFNTFEIETVPNLDENLAKLTKIIKIKSDKNAHEVFEEICVEFDQLKLENC
jgi:UMP-CMP kinase